MYLQENSLNPKKFLAKSNQMYENNVSQRKVLKPKTILCKIRPKVRKYAKIMNGFAAIYIAAKCFFGGARRYFSAEGNLSRSSVKILRNSSAELRFHLT